MLQVPLTLNVLIFAASAAMVWIAGTRLAITAEELADRYNLGKALMGLVFLAIATELPELVTTIVAAIEGQAELLLNNMFGGIALQTAILAIADATAVKIAITAYPRKPTPILEGALLVLLMALLHAIVLFGDYQLFRHVGLGSALLALLYVLSIVFIRRIEVRSPWSPTSAPNSPEGNPSLPILVQMKLLTTRHLSQRFVLASLVILIFGVSLVRSAEAIAFQSGLGTSFVGVTLLAGSTSLPELSTTVMAVRLGSYTMAISNIFGSNLVMLLLLLPADLLYLDGPLLSNVDRSATYAIVCGIVVSMFYIVGLVARGTRTLLGMGYDSVAVLVFYAISLIVLYTLR